MRKLLLLGLLLLPPAASADDIILTTYSQPTTVSVHLERPADYVALYLAIEADIKDPVRRIEAIASAMAAIEVSVQGKPDITIESGTVSLSVRQDGKFLSSSYGARRSEIGLYLLAALSSEQDLYAQTKALYRTASAVTMPRHVTLSFGNTVLGVRDPESHRMPLLQLVRDEVAVMRAALGAKGKVSVSGLEQPVHAVPKDDANVTLYIPYKLTVDLQ